jgi:hypothetical protein
VAENSASLLSLLALLLSAHLIKFNPTSEVSEQQQTYGAALTEHFAEYLSTL